MENMRILLAEEDSSLRKYIRTSLVKAGYIVIGDFGNGRTAGQAMFVLEPDILLLSTSLPERDGYELAKVSDEQGLAPAILLAPHIDWQVIDKAKEVGAFACLPKDISEVLLWATIEMAHQSFIRQKQMETKLKALQANIRSRQLVEKAKRFLIAAYGWSENEAYEYLRKKSMDYRIPIDKVARLILGD